MRDIPVEELDALYRIVTCTADVTGEQFFCQLVQQMAAALDVAYAFVSVFTDQKRRMRMLAFWDGTEVLSGIEYDLATSPCREVATGKVFHCARDIQARFPEDQHLQSLGAESYRGVPLVAPSRRHIGHVGVVDIKPLAPEPRFITLMEVFATRTAAELDRLDAERALSASERRLDAILCSAKDVIISIDDQRCVTLFNDAAERVFSYPRAEVVGKPIDPLLSSALCEQLEQYMTAPQADGDVELTVAHNRGRESLWLPQGFEARRANGDAFPIEATISWVSIDRGNYYTLILRDINERIAAQSRIEQLTRDRDYLNEELKQQYDVDAVIGRSSAMKELTKHIDLVARTDASVLILGETGTGKELIARTVHARSHRSDRPLVKVNCAALPAPLIESELFGHERGSFTGASSQRIGRFELANEGTIFLDEIGELPLDLQPKLLRVLQEQEFERVGSSKTMRVNVRVIAATNRDLKSLVEQGAFRDDLYYRLMVFPLRLRPLRDRRDDIQLLAEFFVHRYAKKIGRARISICEAGMRKLLQYPWPGNVRELQSIIERAVILSTDSTLNIDLAFGLALDSPETIAVPEREPETAVSLQEVERRHIIDILEQTSGVIEGPNGAAKLLQINPSTLRSRMRKLGIGRS